MADATHKEHVAFAVAVDTAPEQGSLMHIFMEGVRFGRAEKAAADSEWETKYNAALKRMEDLKRGQGGYFSL